MKAAAQMAQVNMDKDSLAADLEKISEEIKIAEKRKEWLKAKLDPLMTNGERIGKVEKVKRQDIIVDGELLVDLEKRFGPEIVRKECNVKLLREKFLEDPALEPTIPKGPEKWFLKVGEQFNK